jgi:DNA-binding LacI/PurR family transcriptional regulator
VEYAGLRDLADRETYDRLEADVLAGRLSGVVFLFAPDNLAGTPVLTTPGLPRVTLTARTGLPGVMVVHYDWTTYARKVMNYMASRGRRRIAVIDNDEVGVGLIRLLQAAAPDVSIPERWQQAAAINCPLAAKNLMELLMQGTPHERPDGIIIADDHLVADITDALAAIGVRSPEDVDIVAHANFPCVPVAAMPVYRVGYDARDILRVSLDCIDDIRRRGKTPDERTIAPLTQDEVPGPISEHGYSIAGAGIRQGPPYAARHRSLTEAS